MRLLLLNYSGSECIGQGHPSYSSGMETPGQSIEATVAGKTEFKTTLDEAPESQESSSISYQVAEDSASNLHVREGFAEYFREMSMPVLTIQSRLSVRSSQYSQSARCWREARLTRIAQHQSSPRSFCNGACRWAAGLGMSSVA